MKNEKIQKGAAVNEVMAELAFRTQLRRLAEERERRLRVKKRKEACIGGNSQASIKELTLDNNITKRKKCQAGGVLCDD